MAVDNFIFDASPENFAELVLGNSMQGPVMVNFWSAKAGPCLKLWPQLEQLVEEYAGRFLLINFNVDKYQDFARTELAITSVPTVKIFSQQQVVDVIHGAESASSFRAMINRHMPRMSDTLLRDLVDVYQRESFDVALPKLKELQQRDPDNPRISLVIIKLMFREAQYEALKQYVMTLSAQARKNEEVIHLLTMAEVLETANQAPELAMLQQAVEVSKEDIDSRFQLSAVYLVNDDYVAAMDQLLEIIRMQKNYRDDIALKTMVSILNIMGSDTELARSYRQKMLDALSA